MGIMVVNNPLNRWSDFPSGGSRSVGGTLRPQAKYWYGLEFGTFPTLQSSHHSGSWVGWAPFISGTVGCDLLPVPSEKSYLESYHDFLHVKLKWITCRITKIFLHFGVGFLQWSENVNQSSLWRMVNSILCHKRLWVPQKQFLFQPGNVVPVPGAWFFFLGFKSEAFDELFGETHPHQRSKRRRLGNWS